MPGPAHGDCSPGLPVTLLAGGRAQRTPPPPTQSSRATASKEARLPCIPGSLLAPAGPSPLSNISPDPPHRARAGTSLPTPQAAPGVTGQGPWPTRFCASDWHSQPLPGGPLLVPSGQPLAGGRSALALKAPRREKDPPLRGRRGSRQPWCNLTPRPPPGSWSGLSLQTCWAPKGKSGNSPAEALVHTRFPRPQPPVCL